MKIIEIETPLIKLGDDLIEILLEAIGGGKILEEKDILVIASSAVSSAQDRAKKISDVEPSENAKEFSKASGLDENFVEIILQESDKVLSAGEKSILTVKDGMLKVNAGADRTNVPSNQALLMPENPEKTATKIREELEEKSGKKLGVIISDSHVQPLRLGTTGQAIATSGIKEALDCREQKDLYGRELQITFRNIGDQIAAAAQLVMGEADESVPAVIVRGASPAFSEKPGKSLKIPSEDCIYSGIFDYK